MLLPSVLTTPGPTYAQEQNDALNIVDAHDHTIGKGLQVPTAGININADLPFGGFNLNLVRGLRLNPLSATSTAGTDVSMVYSVNGDLYYNNSGGAPVQITSGSGIVGTSGSIANLSAPASAAFSDPYFIFLRASSTPAKLKISSIDLFEYGATTSANPVTIKSPSSLAANYNFVLPPAVPTTAGSILQSDTSGNTSWQSAGLLPIGAVVPVFNSLTGTYQPSATSAADAYGFVLCNGQAIYDTSSPMNGQNVPNINSGAFVFGGSSSSNTISGSTTSTALLAHTHGSGSFATSVGITGSAPTLSNNTVASQTHTHDSPVQLSGSTFFVKNINGTGSTWGSGSAIAIGAGSTTGTTIATVTGEPNGGSTIVGISGGSYSTTGSNNVTGSSGSAGSGTSFSIMPPYVTAVWVMRIK